MYLYLLKVEIYVLPPSIHLSGAGGGLKGEVKNEGWGRWGLALESKPPTPRAG